MHVAVEVVTGFAIAVSVSTVRRPHGGTEGSTVPVDPATLEGAQLQVLRAQITSHFVYKPWRRSRATSAPTPTRRASCSWTGGVHPLYAVDGDRLYVTLAEELEHVARYLHLERARFGKRLNVEIEVDPEALDSLLPMLSLQPLVENAVRHVVERSPGVGHIEIVGRAVGRNVEVRVSDDGAGIDAERARAALDGAAGGIGLPNVQARLHASFGDEYGLSFESGGGVGTTVIMSVPRTGNGAVRR